VPGALQCVHKLPLVLGTRSGDALRDDLPLFRDKPLEAFLVFVVDVFLLGRAESAGALLPRDLVVAITPGSALCSFFHLCYSPFSCDGAGMS
jgi:hypothetical protein